jgi:hypothetical protein
MKIQFKAYNIIHQYLRSDKSYRIIMDISADQKENAKDIILDNLPEGTYEISIEPELPQ